MHLQAVVPGPGTLPAAAQRIPRNPWPRPPSAQAAAADANGSAAGTDAVAPYASVVPYVWRLNVTRSDLPYALLRPTVVDEPASLVRARRTCSTVILCTCWSLGLRSVVLVVFLLPRTTRMQSHMA